MKISKLFHWLYATLMFLPFLFFVPTLIYYGFNEHANVPTSEVQDYQEEYINFNQLLSSINSNTPTYFNFSEGLLTLNGNPTSIVYCVSNSIQGYQDHIYLIKAIDNASWNDNISTYFLANGVNNLVTSNTRLTLSNDELIYFNVRLQPNVTYNTSFYPQVFDLTQIFGAGNEPTISEFNSIFTDNYYSYTLSRFEWVDIPLTTTTTYADIDSNISFAWQKIWQLPLFNWTNISFIKQPFTYVTALFGMQPTNTFNNIATYFVTVSICWLVFDLLMYVPNLVHRWLDRGAIQ